MKEKITLFAFRVFLFSALAYILLFIGQYLSIRYPEFLIAYASVIVGLAVAMLFLLWEE